VPPAPGPPMTDDADEDIPPPFMLPRVPPMFLVWEVYP
jgi:hypothetical protein